MTLEATTSSILFYVNTAVQLYLSLLFFSKYKKDNNKISIVWSAGFLLYGLSGIIFEAVRDDILPKSQFTLFIRSSLIALGISLFYYGTSLLFFDRGSFKREKASIMLILVMLFANIYFIYLHSHIGIDQLIDILNNLYVYVFIVPVFLLMSYLFARAAKNLKYGDPRRINIILVSAGWGCIALFNLFYPITYSSESHVIVRSGAIVSRLLLLVGMTKFAASMSQQ